MCINIPCVLLACDAFFKKMIQKLPISLFPLAVSAFERFERRLKLR